MISNVLINGYTAFIAGYEEFYFGIAFQGAFAVFVFFGAWGHGHAIKGDEEAI